MSVLCQNFVQNAWKKDLCSNCFKSVGDHESIHITEDSGCHEYKNGRNTPSSPSHDSVKTETPHTTWRSLISEKNGKNTQPFRLENGFQGRLLTINKALNGSDHRQNNDETNRKALANSKPVSNGTSVKTSNFKNYPALNETSVRALNGVLNKQIAEKSENVQRKLNGTVQVEENECCSDKFKNIQENGEKPFNKQNSSEKINNQSQDKTTDKKLKQIKFTKSKSEDIVTEPKSIQGILKKTTSTPIVSGSRRSSNVGFKEEEPLVIGYGGRDFSPEELEWEMASDGDAEGTADSLDETEDDKMFSNITKQNTEFNSDNANLLEIERLEKEKSILENKKKQAEINESQKQNKIGPKKDISKSEAGTEKSVNPEDNICKGSENKNRTNDLSTNTPKNNEISNKNTAPSESLKTPVHPDIGDTNKSIKSGETNHAEKKSDSLLIQTGESGVSVKNSSKLINGASPTPFTVNVSKSTENGKAVMFSDGVEPSWQGNNTSDGNNEWQKNEEISGQILQAINTSLTNRHKMEQNSDLNTNENSEDVGVSQQEKSDGEINTISVLVSNRVEEVIEKSENLDENILNVEPRQSFLHGVSTKPSAIYGPASDLFVSRSDSSSSSSSDELGKSRISLSVNVTVNGEHGSQNCNGNEDHHNELCDNNATKKEKSPEKTPQNYIDHKAKPKIPTKPVKPPPPQFPANYEQVKHETNKNETVNSPITRTCESVTTEEATYYSTIPEEPKSPINMVGPYAESNIYHEVNDKDLIKTKDHDPSIKVPGRESKLAALAIELEQVRNINANATKRQAPAPPKIPDPPVEDPPSCTGRVSPPSEISQPFSTFKGESMGFSSASSTTSTSSQDTEAGYASWNVHGDSDDPRKHKFKSSFLLAQYSKCKMLAMGVAEDSARARKRFSIKKLLKLGKEAETPIAIDPNCPNPKAWKYSDHFERPRAKLEIIHPMDLEHKSVAVNPGFESMHGGSMTSFSPNADETSLKRSASSDYGSFYSDTMSPLQDHKQEVNYEYIQPRLISRDEQEESSFRTGTSGSTSPTPSRSSTASQTSTVTSGSSKNGHRPPKPPPPPRAHSLLPGNKIVRNVDGTFRFPINGDTSSSDEVTTAPTKPQAPRRQCKSAIIKSEHLNPDEQNATLNLQNLEEETLENSISNQNHEEIYVKNTSTIQIGHTDNQTSHNHEDTILSCSSPTVLEGVYDNLVTEKESKLQTSITITSNNPSQTEKFQKSMLSRNKHPPLTKSPARPPPIYSKPQSGNFPKNMHPWKTLEDSYLALTSCNRELLIKLLNQALKKKKILISKLNKCQFQWSDFEIDTSQQSSIFAFGEKIAYHATMPKNPQFVLTLVVTVQHHGRLQDTSEMKYPIFGKFTDCIPSDLLDSADDSELESIPATVLVLDRSEIATIESFSESLPDELTEENEKELCFIILQLIQSLKSLQVQGIESIDSNFQNLLLAKTKNDKYHSLIFLYDSSYDESDYSSESTKISLCQYTLMLLYQILKLQVIGDDGIKYSSEMSKKVFETAFSLLSEEKAVSLSQTKTLFECYLWGVTKVLESFQSLEDCDNVLHRWLDIERSIFIKNLVNDEDSSELNVQNECYSQFLIRTNARNIKEIAFYL